MAKNPFKQNAKLFQTEDGRLMVSYTCPQCGFQQGHLWFGRDTHYCVECEYGTEIKTGVDENIFFKKSKQ